MDEQRSFRACAVFAQASDLPEEERGAFLDAACAGEPDLRAELESLLAYDSSFELGERDDRFLNSPVVRIGEETLRMQEALKSLGPLDRKVLALRHFERLGRVEAAQSLGISQEEGAKRYLGALRRLKDALRRCRVARRACLEAVFVEFLRLRTTVSGSFNHPGGHSTPPHGRFVMLASWIGCTRIPPEPVGIRSASSPSKPFTLQGIDDS